MNDLESRILDVAWTQSFSEQELIDYLELEGWEEVHETVEHLFKTGDLVYDADDNVCFALTE